MASTSAPRTAPRLECGATRRGSTARRRGVTDPPRPASAGRVHRQHGYPAMTHFTSDGGAPAALPALVSRPEAAATTRAPSLDRNRLHEAIAVRRQRLAEREVDLVAACAKAVAHDAGRHIRLDDRTTWDRAAWNRYVGMATRLEPEFMPELLRLIRDIERLERLAAFRAPSRASAASAAARQNGRYAEAQAPHRRRSPRVDARSKPVSVPLPYPRFAVQARTRACHDRRSAFGSRRFRVAPLPRRPQCSGAGRSRHRFPLTAPEGTTPAWEPAPVLRGTTEGMKRCPDSSTACN